MANQFDPFKENTLFEDPVLDGLRNLGGLVADGGLIGRAMNPKRGPMASDDPSAFLRNLPTPQHGLYGMPDEMFRAMRGDTTPRQRTSGYGDFDPFVVDGTPLPAEIAGGFTPPAPAENQLFQTPQYPYGMDKDFLGAMEGATGPAPATAPTPDIFGKPSTPYDLALGGQGSTDPNALPPLTPEQQARQDALTGVPQTGQAPTAPEGSRLEKIQQGLGGVADMMGLEGEERNQFMKREMYNQARKEASAGLSAQSMIKSLEREGMTKDQIRNELNLSPDATRLDALQALKGFNNRRKQDSEGKTRSQLTLERAEKNGEYYTDESGKTLPANPAAHSGDFVRIGSEPGYPESDEPLTSFMSPGDLAAFNRNNKFLSGQKKDTEASRKKIAYNKRVVQTAQRKATTKRARDAYDTAQANAQDAKAKKTNDTLWKEFEMIQKRMKKYEDAKTDKEKAKIMSEDQYKQYQSRSGQIVGTFGGASAPAQTTEQATDEVPTFNSEQEARAAGHKSGDTVRIAGIGKGVLD